MTREKKKVPAPTHGVSAAARRAKLERALQYDDSIWRTLNPLKAPPKVKHKSYFEAVDNTDKKKKLEFEITTDRIPPPGFEFIPTGHPELSQECKEQSRECDAMFFIVSMSKNTANLDHHMNRLGYHFRWNMVDAARNALRRRGLYEEAAFVHNEAGRPEPIPNSQWEIDQEADAVLRDLFPRIPNTDRQEIITHAFKKDGTFNGDFKVGMAKDITLARRVQLAALAHIRHTHTRYDELLKESDWANARKAVEKPCLDIIVKWRGDEETGRDQLDEILREVIEISDTEDESEDESSSADDVRVGAPQTGYVAVSMPDRASLRLPSHLNQQVAPEGWSSSPLGPYPSSKQHRVTKAERRTARKTQQRFKRYAAAAEALANSSNQNGHPESHSTPGTVATSMEVVRAHPVITPYHATTSSITQEPYNPTVPYGRTEAQNVPASYSNGYTETRVAGMPNGLMDARTHGATEQFIRIPDAQRPKVGPYSAKKQSLQDEILPSIEPASPEGQRVMHDISQRIYREPQHSTEVPSVISRTILEPGESGYLTRSPCALVNDNELATKRRRVTTYFREDFQRDPNPSYVRVARNIQDDGLRRPQLQYLPDQRQLVSRAPARVGYEDAAWPSGQEVRVIRSDDCPSRSGPHSALVSGDLPSPARSRVPDGAVYQGSSRVATRQEIMVQPVNAPVRSRGNPIVIDRESSYAPRRVVEVRGSPAREIYRTTSPRGTFVHRVHVQEDPRLRDSQRVIYVDESMSRLRRGDDRHYISHTQPESPTYQEASNISLQPLTIRHARQYSVDRRIIQASEPEQTAPIQSGIASRHTQARYSEAPALESFPVSQHQSYRTHPHLGAVQQQPVPQEPRGDVIYREIRPEVTRPSAAEYERGPQQPFPVFPARSSYAEIRGPSMHRRSQDYRDLVYVE